jgi:hypothetical protein
VKLKLTHLTLASLLLGPGLAYPAYRQIKVGDTLTQIAESNYGNWVKWKDLWNLNRENIPNPDLIYPGQRLRLLTDEELALFVKNDADVSGLPGFKHASDADPEVTTASRGRRGQEWRLLPTQSWERFVFRTDPAVDADGFDRRSRIAVRVADKTTANVTIASDRIPILGEITNARTEYARLFLGDQAFIRPDEPLQVGTTYSVTSGPQKIVSNRDGRVGFGYDLMGKLKIIGVRDGVFIGIVTSLYYPILRHHLLIPEVKDYVFPTAVVAPTPLSASIVVPEGARDDLLGQQKIILLDVGTADGVKPGMIFRHYLHVDPHNQEAISAKDFLIEAEVQVLSTQDKFSVGIILASKGIMHFGDDLVALTDLADFEKNQGLQTILQDSAKPSTVDDLDQMDANDGLGEKENHDLRQLEKWSKPIPETSVSPISSDEIMRVDTHDHPKQTFDIGKEPAPNDGSSKPETAPNPTPVPLPTPEPTVVTPSPTPVVPEGTPIPPAPESTPDPQLDTSATPAPIPETPAAPEPEAPANPKSALPGMDNTDPFAVPPSP